LCYSLAVRLDECTVIFAWAVSIDFMRIIAGDLKGRQFEAPKGNRTHPMSEKMRGAIFGALGDIKGLTVLDAFAGSGALSFEAISRGAESSTAIEVDKKAHNSIQISIKALGVEGRVKATKAFVNSWSNRNHNTQFDLIFADPPYNSVPYRDLNSLPDHLKVNGTLVLSWPGKADWYPFKGLKLIQIKKYNDSSLIFYKKVV
jgi:16S rRNA (guanine966-N2)-methyltransferase